MAEPINTEALAEQLRITTELAAATREMASAIDSASNSMNGQADIARSICDALKNCMDMRGLMTTLGDMGKVLKDMLKELQQIKNATAGFGQGVVVLGNGIEDLTDNTDKSAKALNDFQKAQQQAEQKTLTLSQALDKLWEKFKKMHPGKAGFVVGFIKGMSSAFQGLMAITKSVVSIMGKVVDAAFQVTKAIISIPFKMFDALIDMALQGGGGLTMYEAWQDVKEVFGSLKQDTPKMMRELVYNSDALKQNGLSIRKIFGSLPEYLKQMNELFKEMGPYADLFVKEFVDSEGALIGIQRGLGLSNEEMQTMTSAAMTTGETLSDTMLRMHKLSKSLGESFGISAKLINRDVVKAMKDVTRFGGATQRELQVAAVYARRLGTELEKIAGTLDKFETFEGAADAVSRLAQSFGMNVDVLGMLDAQDPAKHVDQLRKSFFAAGNDAEKMTRQQLKYLAANTGVDESIVKQTFSLKNQGMSLDKINQKSKEAEKRQIDQATAMKELADAIKLTVQSGSVKGGYFSQFFQGFELGLRRSAEFRGLLRDIRKGLREARMAGIEFGRAFMDMFPGFKDMIQGLRKILAPGNIRSLFRGITDEFKWFMNALSASDSPASFTMLMDRLKKRFFDFFSTGSPGGKQFLDGLKVFTKAVSTIISGMIRWMADNVKQGIINMVDLLTGKKKLADMSGASSFIMDALKPIWEALKYAWVELQPIVSDLMTKLGDMAVKFLQEKVMPALAAAAPYVLGAIFAPAVISGLVSAFAAKLSSMLGAAIGNALRKKNPLERADRDMQAAQKKINMQNLGKNKAMILCMQKHEALKCEETFLVREKALNKIRMAAGRQAIDIEALEARRAAAQAAGPPPGYYKQLMLKMIAMAAAIAIGGVALAIAVVAIANILRGTSPTEVAMAIGVLLATAVATSLMVGAMGKINPASILAADVNAKGMALFLAGSALVLAASLAGYFAIMSLFDPVSVINGIMAMVGVAVAGGILISVLSLIPPGSQVLAGKNALMLARFLTVLIPLSATAGLVGAMIKALEVDFASLAMAIFAMIGVAGAAAIMAPALIVAGNLTPKAIPGAWLLTKFMGLALLPLIAIMGLVYLMAESIGDPNKLVKIMAAVALASIATLPLMFAATAALKLAGPAMIGAAFLIGFFALGVLGLLWGLSLVANSAKDFDVSSLIVKMGALLIVAALAIPLMLASAASIVAAPLGLIGINLLGWFLEELFDEFNELLNDSNYKNVKPEALREMQDRVGIMADVLEKMAPALKLSSGLAGFFGVGFIGTRVGMGVMVDVTKDLAKGSGELVDIIKTMPAGAESKQQVETFVAVTGALGSLLGAMTGIMTSLTPLLEEIDDSGEEFSKTLGGVSGIFESILGSRTEKTGLIGLLDVFFEGFKEVMKYSGVGKSAMVFVKIMEILPNMLNALKPSDKMYEAMDGWTVSIDKVKQIGQQTVAAIATTGTQMMSLLAAIRGYVIPLLNTAVPKPESAAAIATVMQAMASLVTGILPSPDLIKSFETKAFIGTDLDISNVTKFMEVWLPEVSKFFGLLVKNDPETGKPLLQGIIDSAKQIDVSELKQMSGIAHVLEAIGGMLSAVAAGMSAAMSGVKIEIKDLRGVDPATIEAMKGMMPDASKFATMFGELGRQMATFVDQMVTAISKFPDPETKMGAQFAAKLEVAAKTFEIMGQIPVMLKTFMETEREERKALADEAGVNEDLKRLIDSKSEEIAQTTHTTNAMGKLMKMFNDDLVKSMDKFAQAVSALPSSDHFIKQLEATSKMFDILKTLPELAKTIREMDFVQSTIEKTAKGMPVGGTDEKTSTTQIKAIEEEGAKFTSLISTLSSVVVKPDGSNGVIIQMLEKINQFAQFAIPGDTAAVDLFSKKMEAVKNLFEIFKAIPNLAKTMKDVNFLVVEADKKSETGGVETSEKTQKMVSAAQGLSSMFVSQMEELTSIIVDPKSKFLEAITKLKDFVSATISDAGYNSAGAFEKKLGAVQKLFDIMKSFPELAQTLAGLGQVQAQTQAATAGAPPPPPTQPKFNFQETMANFTTFMSNFVGDGAQVGEQKAKFQTLVQSVGKMYDMIKEFGGKGGKVSVEQAFPAVAKFMHYLSALMASVGGMSNVMSGMSGKTASGKAMSASQAIAAKMQEVVDVLNQVTWSLSVNYGGKPFEDWVSGLYDKIGDINKKLRSKGGFSAIAQRVKTFFGALTPLVSAIASMMPQGGTGQAMNGAQAGQYFKDRFDAISEAIKAISFKLNELDLEGSIDSLLASLLKLPPGIIKNASNSLLPVSTNLNELANTINIMKSITDVGPEAVGKINLILAHLSASLNLLATWTGEPIKFGKSSKKLLTLLEDLNNFLAPMIAPLGSLGPKLTEFANSIRGIGTNLAMIAGMSEFDNYLEAGAINKIFITLKDGIGALSNILSGDGEYSIKTNLKKLGAALGSPEYAQATLQKTWGSLYHLQEALKQIDLNLYAMSQKQKLSQSGEVSQIFSSIGSGMIALTNSLNGVGTTYEGKKFSELFTDLDKAIGENQAAGAVDVGKSLGGFIEELVKSFGDNQTSIGKLEELHKGISPILESLNRLFTSLSSVSLEGSKSMFEFRDRMLEMSSLLTGLGNMGPDAALVGLSAGQLAASLQGSIESIETHGLSSKFDAIEGMIARVNHLNQSLSNLGPIDIVTPLTTMANGLGLGHAYNYEITNEPVHLTINMQVLIQAKDLEEAIILRADSVIKDRLNFATQNPDAKGSVAIGNSMPSTPMTRSDGGARQG